MIADCYHQLVDEMDTARSIQLELVALLEPGSRRAGYKVGLTDSKAQEMFAISQPLVGVLFEYMLLQDGARRRTGFRHVADGGTGFACAGEFGRHQPGRIG